MLNLERFAQRQLDAWKGTPDRQPLLVTGARQVGKTSLVRNYAMARFNKIHEFNFETTKSLHQIFAGDLEPKSLLRDLGLAVNQSINLDTDLIFFDEIQACPAALTSLKYFSERLPKACVIAAGSHLGLPLSSDSFPVGKVDRINIYPLTFEEFLRSCASKVVIDSWDSRSIPLDISETMHQHFWSIFLDYLIVGGMPAVVVEYLKYAHLDSLNMRDAYAAVRLKQNSLLLDYISDIAKHSGKINARHIEAIWNQIPIQLSKATDESTSRFRFKDVIKGLHAFRDLGGPIDWLVKAGLSIRVPICHHAEEPLTAFTKENLFKLFVFDTGLLGAMVELRPAAIRNFDFGTYKGFLIENFVAQELNANPRKPKLFAWSEGDAEIEFLVQGDQGVIPIEVKSGTRIRSSSLKRFLEKYRPKASVILSGRAPTQSKNAGVTFEGTIMHNFPIYLATIGTLEDKVKSHFPKGSS